MGVERERGGEEGKGERGRWKRGKMAADRARWMISPRTERESLVWCLLLTSHSSSPGYSTMREYQYPLTDTDVGQFATNVFITSVVLSSTRNAND